MQLEHEFIVPVSVERAWEVLLDVEQVAPCMPGAVVEAVDEDSFNGHVKVKVGPIVVSYAGRASFLEKDSAARRVVVEAKGRETRGSGTATATVSASMIGDGDRTHVTVVTDLAITGKPAQFGRGVMNDVGKRLLGQFADCLASTLSEDKVSGDNLGATAPDSADELPSMSTSSSRHQSASQEHGGTPESRPTPEAIDLLATAGGAVAKRLAPIIAVLGFAALLVWGLTRCGG